MVRVLRLALRRGRYRFGGCDDRIILRRIPIYREDGSQIAGKDFHYQQLGVTLKEDECNPYASSAASFGRYRRLDDYEFPRFSGRECP